MEMVYMAPDSGSDDSDDEETARRMAAQDLLFLEEDLEADEVVNDKVESEGENTDLSKEDL